MRLVYWAALTLVVAVNVWPWGVLGWLAVWMVVCYQAGRRKAAV